MIALGDELGIEIVATNNVHYNIQKNHRINDVLVSIKHNTSIYNSHSHRRAKDQFYLKSPSEMLTLVLLPGSIAINFDPINPSLLTSILESTGISKAKF